MANVTAAGRESAAKVQEQRMKTEAAEISGKGSGGGRGGAMKRDNDVRATATGRPKRRRTSGSRLTAIIP